jgi:hypothetical protein
MTADEATADQGAEAEEPLCPSVVPEAAPAAPTTSTVDTTAPCVAATVAPAAEQSIASAAPTAGTGASLRSTAPATAGSAQTAQVTDTAQEPVVATISAAVGPQGSGHSDDAPLPVPAPPTTTVVGGSSGCGGPGMGQGAAKGSAPASAVLSDSAAVHFAGNATARTAQVAGPVVTTTADPATRPD